MPAAAYDLYQYRTYRYKQARCNRLSFDCTRVGISTRAPDRRANSGSSVFRANTIV